MKKLLTLALLATVGVASAASIDWVNSSSRNTYVWDKDGNKFNGTAYLVLADDVDDILAPTETESFTDLLGDKKLGSTNLSNGAYALANTTITDDRLTAGTEYDFQVILVDSDGNYKISGTKTNAAYNSATDDPTKITFTKNDFGAAGSAPDNPAGAWTDAPVYGGGGQGGGEGGGGETIPEPATGALALAGVALLFKRRRA